MAASGNTRPVTKPRKGDHEALRGRVTLIHGSADQNAKSIYRARPEARTTHLSRQATKVRTSSVRGVAT